MHVNKIFILIFIVMLLVGLVSSFMGSTWAVILWNFVYTDYPIITYEIGYEEQPSDISGIKSEEAIIISLGSVTALWLVALMISIIIHICVCCVRSDKNK